MKYSHPTDTEQFDFHLIDGQRIRQAGVKSEIRDPANGQLVAQLPIGTAEIVSDAVASSAQALKGNWGQLAPYDRAQLMFRLADLIDQNDAELAALETVNVGKPYSQALRDVGRTAKYFRFYAGVCDKLNGETVSLGPDQTGWVQPEPVGVTAHILPWNYPISTFARGAAPALAAGATVVAKPAEETPISALTIAELALKAGIPAGVLNVVCGDGSTGAALASHPDVAQVTFTGSTATGRKVMQAASNPIAGVTLELGGKSPVVVLNGANVDDAVAGLARGIFFNAGQICTAGSRLIVSPSLHDEVVEKLSAYARGMSVDHGLNDPDLGPLISLKHRDRVSGFVERARADGLECVLGGHGAAPANCPGGAFYAPTIFTHVPVDAEIAQAEVFGPVLTTHIAQDADEALQIANATRYGLVAGIYTPDITQAMQFARNVEAGQVFINGFLKGGDTLPFGGVKESGIGREKGLAAMASYTAQKSVVISH